MKCLYLVVVVLGCSPSRRPSDSSEQNTTATSSEESHSGDAGVPLVVAMVTIDEGKAWASPTSCGHAASATDFLPAVQQRVDAFRIDTDTASCSSWNDCVSNGACEAQRWDLCIAGKAYLTRESAAALCADRGARLPTPFEWSRAVRGDSNTADPWNGDRSCEHPTASGQRRRCVRRTPSGLLIGLENPNVAEWTDADDCFANGRFHRGVDLRGFTVGAPTFNPAMEVRCAVSVPHDRN